MLRFGKQMDAPTKILFRNKNLRYIKYIKKKKNIQWVKDELFHKKG